MADTPELIGNRYPERWTPDEGMREISGFGGGYELACWAMLKAGGDWADAHVDQVKAITRTADAPKEMERVMVDAAEPGGATGAMFGTVLSHVGWVINHSWEEWVDQMRADLRLELAGRTEIRPGFWHEHRG